MIQEIKQFRRDMRNNFLVVDSPSLDRGVQVAFRFQSGSVKKYAFPSDADTKVINN